jgi:hypothetical protein
LLEGCWSYRAWSGGDERRGEERRGRGKGVVEERKRKRGVPVVEEDGV